MGFLDLRAGACQFIEAFWRGTAMLLRTILFATIATVAAIAAVVWSTDRSLAHEPHGFHGEGHDHLHHWYKTLRQPFTGYSCCDGTDCRPTTARVRGRTIEVLVDGEWTRVPFDKILKKRSPDMNTHVCAPKGPWSPKVLFCVVIGLGV